MYGLQALRRGTTAVRVNRSFLASRHPFSTQEERPASQEDKDLQDKAFEKKHGQPRNLSSDSEAAVKAERETDDNVEDLQKATEKAAEEDHKDQS